MENVNKYIYVSGDFYEVSNGNVNSCAKFKIRRNLTDEEIRQIPKYKGFVNVPSHNDYQQVINGCYNLYKPFAHEPKPGKWKNIERCLRHVFQEQYEYGLDYIQLMYQRPTQRLPVLLLTANDRNCGRTTFIEFIFKMFEGNSRSISRDMLFSYVTSSLLVTMDDFLINGSVIDKIKYLCTSNNIVMNQKAKESYQLDVFTKFILAPKNGICFAEEENRFWVLEMLPVKMEDDKFYMVEKMIKEIPAFVDFLNGRELSTKRESRQWFDLDSLNVYCKVERDFKLVDYENHCSVHLDIRSDLLKICDVIDRKLKLLGYRVDEIRFNRQLGTAVVIITKKDGCHRFTKEAFEQLLRKYFV